MTEKEIKSGADHVDQTEQLEHGLSAPHDDTSEEVNEENATDAPVKTHVSEMTLTMFTQGASTRVRVGNAHNASELYELAFDSPDEANAAMLEAGILTAKQVPNTAKLAGTGIELENITIEQLEAAGLKRHNAYTG